MRSAEDAFASVATALLQSGMRSVVAMAYSLYVSGAQVFLPAFYRRLFEAGSIAEAVRAGRQEMLAHKGRVCVRGRYPLEDWLLPVLYQQDPLDFSFAAAGQGGARTARTSRLPEEVREHRDPYGFVGRDGPILEMERALHRKAPAILVQGLGGVGKTTLARGVPALAGRNRRARWRAVVRFPRYPHRRVCDQSDRARRFTARTSASRRTSWNCSPMRWVSVRVLMVWDNFESAAANLTSEDRAELGRFLDAIRGGRGKVIITSRSRRGMARADAAIRAVRCAVWTARSAGSIAR